METTTRKSKKELTLKISELPEFIKTQLETINSLQKRVNQLNRDFEIEKNCKNQVYYFIMDKNHMEEYMEYNKENPTKKL